MARQVFFDPFGNYTRGLDTGIARQMELERGTRDARAMDFDYNYMTPLRYDNALMDTQLKEFGIPYAQNALQYNDRNLRRGAIQGDYNFGEQAASRFGDVSPMQRALTEYFGTQFRPQADQTSLGVYDPTGVLQTTIPNARQTILEDVNRPKIMQDAALQQQLQQQGFENRAQTRGLEIDQWQALAPMINAYLDFIQGTQRNAITANKPPTGRAAAANSVPVY